MCSSGVHHFLECRGRSETQAAAGAAYLKKPQLTPQALAFTGPLPGGDEGPGWNCTTRSRPGGPFRC